MPGLLPDVDPDGLLEYSVVYTDRAVNHMSASFQGVMNDISATLKRVYNAAGVVIVPGSGTFGMEAVARQFATDQNVLVIRNGFFSYRWSQIFDAGSIPSTHTVLKARPQAEGSQAAFAPVPIEEVTAAIAAERPAVVFAPHVETSAGMMLPDDYLKAVADATHAVDGLFVLDCIASGTIWVDMEATGVDVLCSAPQKGWSGPPCAGLVMLSPAGLERLGNTTSSSFACDLRKWHDIMTAYETGGHAYHATMPTDSLRVFRDVMAETEAFGFDASKNALTELGTRVRQLLSSRGFTSVAADGFHAPGVVVAYTDAADIKTGKRFADAGLQIAGGVPLMCDEPDDFSTFRIGLFGLDKISDIDRTVSTLEAALDTFG
ncbi:MAG: alanine--glyoxylate aminotransferase family protein [Acidimicrobiales bacterium]